MTTAPEMNQDQGENWGDGEEGATYPEFHTSLSNHLFTWSPKFPDGSMLVIRANSADALVSAARAAATVADQLMKAWNGAITAPPPPAPMAPAPQQWQQAPQQPNQGYQGQPAWQQAGAPQQAPQNGGQQKSAYPAPQGWFRLAGDLGLKGATLKQHAQSIGLPKGNPNQGGAFNFYKAPQMGWYCSPQAAQALQQFVPVPM
jgi:hypothetical protein